MGNLTNSFILLAIGLTLLWLAATNRLTNWAQAWTDLTAAPNAGTTGVAGAANTLGNTLVNSIGNAAVNQAGNIVSQSTNNGLPSSVTLPVFTSGPVSSASSALEAGGGVSYQLPTLPQIGTLNLS